MIIPFEPKLYMSQIDHKINAETKLSQKEIKETFRRSINAEFARVMKQKMEVIYLLKDTVKYKKELQGIYRNISYAYEKVPDQSNYKTPVADNASNGGHIKNGQILIETSPEARFMNTRVINPALIPGLFAKYKTDIFLFINQLDLFSNQLMANDMGAGISERVVTIHYTVFTIDAKEINSGTCSMKFPTDVNVPTKITTLYINKLAVEISRRISLALNKAEAPVKK